VATEFFETGLKLPTLQLRVPLCICILDCPRRADREPYDDRRQHRAEDQEPAESRRRTADTDDTVLESNEQSSVASQDRGTGNTVSSDLPQWLR